MANQTDNLSSYAQWVAIGEGNKFFDIRKSVATFNALPSTIANSYLKWNECGKENEYFATRDLLALREIIGGSMDGDAIAKKYVRARKKEVIHPVGENYDNIRENIEYLDAMSKLSAEDNLRKVKEEFEALKATNTLTYRQWYHLGTHATFFQLLKFHYAEVGTTLSIDGMNVFIIWNSVGNKLDYHRIHQEAIGCSNNGFVCLHNLSDLNDPLPPDNQYPFGVQNFINIIRLMHERNQISYSDWHRLGFIFFQYSDTNKSTTIMSDYARNAYNKWYALGMDNKYFAAREYATQLGLDGSAIALVLNKREP